MDNYYADLAVSQLQRSIAELLSAIQYAKDANAPEWMIKNLTKTYHGLNNRISDILILREPEK